MSDDRPMAESARVELALQTFPFRETSAAQYAARYAHTIGCSSFDEYRYPDPALGAWIDELHGLLASPAELERCRRLHLSAEEYAALQADIADTTEFGL